MTTDVIELVADDTGPQINVSLTFTDDGTPISGLVNVFMRMRSKLSSTTLTKLTGTIVSASGGTATFELTNFLSNRTAGDYEGEIEVVTATLSLRPFKKIEFFVRDKFAAIS